MSVLPWGKPKVEVCKLEDGVIPASPQWKEIKPIQAESTQLESAEGDELKALEEGGALIDIRRNKPTYTLTLSQYLLKGAEQVIPDDDGLILDNYAVRVTPEDPTNDGFIMKNAMVSLARSFSSTDSYLLTWTFTALSPKDGGKMLQTYNASNEDLES